MHEVRRPIMQVYPLLLMIYFLNIPGYPCGIFKASPRCRIHAGGPPVPPRRKGPIIVRLGIHASYEVIHSAGGTTEWQGGRAPITQHSRHNWGRAWGREEEGVNGSNHHFVTETHFLSGGQLLI